MFKKLIIALILITAMVITGYFIWQNKNIITNNNVVKIGVILPLSGDYAKIGADIKKSIEVAEHDAILSGLIKEGQIKVIFEDNKLDANNTISAYNKLKNIDDIQAVITVTSKCILAIKPLVNKDKIILLNASAISTEIEDSDDFVFSLIPNAKSESNYLSDYILKDQKINDLALIYRNDQSGQSFNDWFSKKYTGDGGIIGITESHPPNTSDFKTIITKLKSQNSIKGVFMASLGIEVANFAKQCKQLNFNIPIYTYESINQPTALDVAGDTINNIDFVSPKFNPNDTTFNSFKSTLKEKYNSDEINFYMISHYNAFMTIAKLVNQGLYSGDEFKTHIPKLGAINFLGSEIKIDSIGNASTTLVIASFKNKQIVIIKE